MLYSITPQNALPTQDSRKIILLSQQFCRDASGHRTWAIEGKTCQDFLEGRQWTEDQLAFMKKKKRVVLTINKIAPLMRLVSGYQRNNRTDINFYPSNDGNSSEETADVIEQVVKSDNNHNDISWVDSEVFWDGMATGRGYWDYRLAFDKNDLGDAKITSRDPFTVYVDADADKYDITNEANRITESRWVSIDEIADTFGADVAETMKNRLTGAGGFLEGNLPVDMEDEIAPIRNFGLYDGTMYGDYRTYRDAFYNEFVDTSQKRIRLLDTQYYTKELKRCFIDLETGDKQAIPNDWDDDRIQKCLMYAQSLNNPMTVAMRPVKTVNWSVVCGDMLIHDQPSPYETFTIIPFFPYFRRGMTRGLVSDLLDPQRELNKKRSSATEVLAHNANPGWKVHKTALDAKEREKLRQHGAEPGFTMEWQGDREPSRIEAGGYPQGYDRLEEKSRNDLLEISGINESALGNIDRVQSGRAIEARQRQAVIALQSYLDNFSRSKKLCGRKHLEIIQNHYTEPRIYRMLGEDSRMVQVDINKKKMGQGGGLAARINDVTVGKYQIGINDTPMSASFQEGQFQEAMTMLQQMGPVGMMLMQLRPDLVVQMSSLPRKEEWTAAITQAVQQMQQQQSNMQAAQQQGAGGGGGQMQPPKSVPLDNQDVIG